MPDGEFDLGRYPLRANEPLQSLDAADRLILRQLEDRAETAEINEELLAVNVS